MVLGKVTTVKQLEERILFSGDRDSMVRGRKTMVIRIDTIVK